MGCRHIYLLFICTSASASRGSDLFATPKDIARNHGYQLQTHNIETEDGYKLRVFRVQDRFSSTPKPPILIHHGFLGSASDFLLMGSKSLPFYLARNGYDVWLANHRGNVFSNGHVRLKMTDPEFWDFSFHEIAQYDVPAVVEYISHQTNSSSKIIYVGHSMGTTIGFIYSSLKHEHAKTHLKGIIALAPVASIRMRRAPVRAWIPSFYSSVRQLLEASIGVIVPYPHALRKRLTLFCVQFPVTCLTVLNVFGGKDEGELNSQTLPLLWSQEPSRTSMKCLAHYLQIILSERFQFYDYNARNVEMYNTTLPPLYPLSNVQIPVHLFYALNDNLVEYEDVVRLFNELKSEKSMNQVPERKDVRYTHYNFIMSKNVVSYLYKPIMKRIKEIELL